MSQANQMVCWGNLTRDPEIRYFEDENSVTNTGMAINKSWTDPQGKSRRAHSSSTFLSTVRWVRMWLSLCLVAIVSWLLAVLTLSVLKIQTEVRRFIHK